MHLYGDFLVLSNWGGSGWYAGGRERVDQPGKGDKCTYMQICLLVSDWGERLVHRRAGVRRAERAQLARTSSSTGANAESCTEEVRNVGKGSKYQVPGPR